ncbi:phage tail tape measure protein [Phascolarctobacterium faecium]|uniref:phage tail tape measure protein n=1 Tax=Phascolarctobacterium faecium TaxID=33025 RepID=UPI003FD7507A
MGTVGNMNVKLGAVNTDLKKGLKESEGLIESTVSKINSMRGQLLSIGAVAMPVAVVRNWAAAVNDLEDKTNMSAESASRLLAVGEYVGLATSDMSDAMAKMSKSAYTAAKSIETAATSGNESMDVFTKFGIQILDTNGRLLSAEQILTNVTNKHRAMANGVEKTAMEMEIFGRSGAKLNDLLNLTESQFQEVYKSAEKTGLVLDHKTTQAFEDAEFEINASKQALRGLAVSIGAQMLPQFQALAEGTRDVARWFAELTPEQRQNAVVALEVAGGAAAVSIAAQGVIAVAAPWIKAIKDVALAYEALKVAALGAAKTAAIVAGGATMIGAAVGAATVGVYSYVNDVSSDEIMRRYTGKNESNVNSSDDYDKVSADFDPYGSTVEAAEFAKKNQSDTTPGTLDFGGSGGRGGGGGSSKVARDTSVQDAREYLALFDDATQKAENFKSTWDSIKGDSDNSLFGRVDEQVAKVEQAYLDAQNARLKAEQDGNAKSAELLAKTEAERLEILRQTQAEADLIRADSLNKYKDAAQKNNDEIQQNEQAHQALLLAMVQGRLEAEDEARLAQLEAKAAENLQEQEMMQAYNDWRMEAEQTYMDFALDAANMLKENLSSGIADAIVNGNKLSDVFKNTGKQIAQMFIQWQISRLMADVLSDKLRKKELVKNKALAQSLVAPAVQKSIAELGPVAAPAAYAGATTQMMSAGMSSGAFATGGVITAPMFALMGEGKTDEAVIPLRNGIFADLLGIDPNAFGGGGTVIEQNIYGDINSAADVNDLFAALNDIIVSGRRG